MKTGNDSFLPVGSIVKAHGLDGEVVVDPVIGSPEQLEDQKLFYIRNQRGDWIPVSVESGKLRQKGFKTSFFVKFEQVADRNAAESMRGQEIYLPADAIDIATDDESNPQSYIGYSVLSDEGEIYGEIIDVLENPAHPIIEVSGDYGHFMIPMVSAYIVNIDEEKHHIIGRNLEQLARV